jgi:Domain of unknown function (DUF4157)
MRQTRQPKPHRDILQPDSEQSAQPLEASTRSLLEPRFGHNFSQVRVHADAEADRLARGYDASAFAIGQDVYFREGQYNPDSASGLHLLAHELTHTIQQRHAAPNSWASFERGARGDSSEREADAAASSVMLGGSASVTTSSAASVQCKDAESKGFFDWMGSASDVAGTIAEISEAAGKGGGALGGPLKAISMVSDFNKGMADDQGIGETIAEVGGKFGAGLLAPYMGLGSIEDGLTKEGVTDLAINSVNNIAKTVGAPESVTDYTGLAADMTASKMTENMLMQGSRGLYNLFTGNDEALANQTEEIMGGDSGSAMQGYGQAFGLYEMMESGENPVDAFEQIGAKSDDTAVARVYEDAVEDIGNGGNRIEDGQYKATSGFGLLDYIIEEGMDLDSAL